MSEKALAVQKSGQAPKKARHDGPEVMPAGEDREPTLRDIKHARKRAFLKAIAETGGNISASARCAGIHKDLHYYWKKKDPIYEQVYLQQHEKSTHHLEAIAIERATEGVAEPIFYQGEQVGERRYYSDRLLELLLKERKPSYRENNQQNVGIFGQDGAVKVEFNIPRPE